MLGGRPPSQDRRITRSDDDGPGRTGQCHRTPSRRQKALSSRLAASGIASSQLVEEESSSYGSSAPSGNSRARLLRIKNLKPSSDCRVCNQQSVHPLGCLGLVEPVLETFFGTFVLKAKLSGELAIIGHDRGQDSGRRRGSATRLNVRPNPTVRPPVPPLVSLMPLPSSAPPPSASGSRRDAR